MVYTVVMKVIRVKTCDLKSDGITSTAFMNERKFVTELKIFISEKNKNFCALVGPRKVGKTICLMQLANWLRGNVETIYYDIENETFLEKWRNVFLRVLYFC